MQIKELYGKATRRKASTRIIKSASALVLTLALIFTSVQSAFAVNSIDAIVGADRYLTAGLIAGRQQYSTAILVNSQNSLADGLSASGLAGVMKAPILLVKSNTIPQETELRLGTVNKVYIIGSENSISYNIESALRNGGINVIRIGGKNRFETSYNVAREILKIKGVVGKVFVANGYKGEADAMSISAVAARDGEPILLSNGKSIDFEARRIISEARRVYAIGGSSSLSNDVVYETGAERIGGKDRFKTNEFIIKYFYPNVRSIFITDSHKLVDALTGGPLAAYEGRPIVLVSERNPNANIVRGVSQITAIGGVSEAAKKAVIAASNK